MASEKLPASDQLPKTPLEGDASDVNAYRDRETERQRRDVYDAAMSGRERRPRSGPHTTQRTTKNQTTTGRRHFISLTLLSNGAVRKTRILIQG
ncbi:hypothetical protein ACHAXS_002053 [Conticribra weissflogii]